MNLFKGIWRCQEKNITRQIRDGVKFFDIRIVIDKHGFFHGAAHGIVDLKMTETEFLLNLLEIASNGGYFRLLVERDECDDYEALIDTYSAFFEKSLVEIRIKNTWKLLYKNPNIKLNVKDMSFVPFAATPVWWKQWKRWKNIFGYPIKRWVKRNKIKLTEEQINDPNVVYFVDYYNYYI